MRRLTRWAAASVLALSLVLTGCGGGSGGGKTLKVGFIGPTTGGLAAFGGGARKSAQLAVDQAIAENKIPGWKIELVAEDDAADAKQGAAAAQKLASDNDVGAVLGTLNSSVAQAVQPILAQADIAMISYANSNPSLTQGLKWQTAPSRPYPNYFRDVTTDVYQGRADAEYAYNDLKRRTAVAIHDKKTYGQGLVNIFSQNFRRLGGTVAATITITPGEGDYKAAVTRAKGSNPDFIFYGGEYPEGGVIAKNMAELGMKPPAVVLMGGDGMVDKTFVKLGGAGAQGHYATSIGASATFLPSAKKFVDDFKAKYNTEDYAIYGPSTYDAARIVIEAAAKALSGRDSIDADARKAIIAEMQKINYTGALGTTTFDKYGDTTNRLLTMNKVEGADFKPLKKLTVE